MPDLEAFVSPIDGKEVRGRVAYREHCKRHNVTNMSDFKGEWERAAKERAKMYTPGAGYDKARRIEAIKYAVEKHMRKR